LLAECSGLTTCNELFKEVSSTYSSKLVLNSVQHVVRDSESKSD
jgi:hypothetical protein